MTPKRIRAVLFDAVGTLIYPDPSVAEVYFNAGRRLGSVLSRQDIAGRFRAAVKKHHQSGQASEPLEWERWRRIVYEIFDDVADPDMRLLDELWQHFGSSSSWRLFEDVAPVWRELKSRGYLVGIASNFDGRLRATCRGLPPLDECRQIFVSSEVGFPKPSLQFYRAVEQQLGLSADEILLVGDDLEPDVTAPRAAGWQAIWLQREQSVPGAITSLKEVLDRIFTQA
jgi:putative hydrolase of the HAD superfamily